MIEFANPNEKIDIEKQVAEIIKRNMESFNPNIKWKVEPPHVYNKFSMYSCHHHRAYKVFGDDKFMQFYKLPDTSLNFIANDLCAQWHKSTNCE